MSQTRKLSQVPEYGWTRKTLLDDVTLNEPGGFAPISEVVDRPAGALTVGISGRVPIFGVGGDGSFGFILEGSNTAGDTIALKFNTEVGGPFTVGETVTGSDSGATGVVTSVSPPATPVGVEGTIVVDSWNAIDFQPGETITGSGSGATAILFLIISEWIELGRTNLNELFTGALDFAVQSAVLGLSAGITSSVVSGDVGFIGSGVVPCGRWTKLRVRTFIVGPDSPTFDLGIRLTAIAGNGEAREESITLTRVSGDTTEPVSDFFIRPEGTRYMSAQMIIDEMLNVPISPATEADGFAFELQAALDLDSANAGEFQTLDRMGPFQTGGETQPMSNGQVRLIDLGSFNYFRIEGFKVDGGTAPPDDLSSYTARALLNFDDNDWLDGARGVGFMPEQLQDVFVQVHFFDPQSAGGDLYDIRVQVTNINLQPIRNTRPVGLLLGDSAFGTTEDLSATGTIDSASKGTLIFGAGTSYVMVQTDSDGEAIIRLDTGGGTVFLMAWNFIPNIPEKNISDFGPGQLLIATERQEIPPP